MVAAATDPRRSAVFLFESVDVDQPAGSISDRICGDGLWLAPLATRATKDGSAVIVRIGPTPAASAVGPKVRILLGRCRQRGASTAVAIRWEATELRPVFPVLDGDLIVTAVDATKSRVTLQASYRPPLGWLGERVDQALMHRLAQATVRSFLARVAERLETQPD
jgi:hypothetical protein